MVKSTFKLDGCEIQVLCRDIKGKRKQIAEEHAIKSIEEALRIAFGFTRK